MTSASSRSGGRPRSRWGMVVALSALAGVLLWAKLRLVSNMPRSVYADPKTSVQAGKDHAGREHSGKDRSASGSHASVPAEQGTADGATSR